MLYTIKVSEEKLAELAGMTAQQLRDRGFDPVSIYLAYWQDRVPDVDFGPAAERLAGEVDEVKDEVA